MANRLSQMSMARVQIHMTLFTMETGHALHLLLVYSVTLSFTLNFLVAWKSTRPDMSMLGSPCCNGIACPRA